MTFTPPPDAAGLIFDCDGTLADTMPAHYVAWTRLFTRLGVAFPEDRFYALGGMPTAGIIRLICGEQGVALPDDLTPLVDEKESTFLTLIDSIRPIGPVLEVYRACERTLPVAVASGGYRAVVARTLQAIGVDCPVVVCAEDTARHKPEPDVFLEAARRLGVDPAGCVVFEDTDLGLEAARRAGMRGVDVRQNLGGRG